MDNRKTADLFNDVMGPVMCGPSSSHTAGPCRMGHLVHDLCSGAFERVDVEFSSKGSYADSYRGYGSNKAMIIGLLGREPDDEHIFDALRIAAQSGLNVVFSITDDAVDDINTVMIRAHINPEKTIAVRMISMGGGSVMVDNIDGLPVALYGGRFETAVYGDASAQRAAQTIIGKAPVAQNDALCVFSTECAVDLDAIRAQPGTAYAATMRPVVPCVNLDGAAPPFLTSQQMLCYLEEKPLSLFEAALLYQESLCRWERARILAWADYLLDRMAQSIDKGLSCDGRGFFCTKPQAQSLENLRQSGGFINTGVLNDATVMATAVMESNLSMNIVIAAPTGGSAGVFPGVLFALKKAGASREALIEGLLCGALVGALIYNQAVFTASVGGCAAEIGSACAMSAAACAHMAGADVKTCLKAAGIALGNLTGLACDHLASGVEVPCIHRNAMGSANAIVAANMAMGGVDPYLNFDESVAVMRDYYTVCTIGIRACGGMGSTGAAGCEAGLRVRREYEALHRG